MNGVKPVSELHGRGLDAAVHEEVIGQKVVYTDWPCGREPECGTYEAAMDAEGHSDPELYNAPWHNEKGPVFAPYPQNSRCYEPVPFYSTDIKAAMTVVEKVSDSGAFAWTFSQGFVCPEWWDATIRKDELAIGAIPVVTKASGDSLTEAICRAAIKWARRAK